ncbi:beta-galactosidase [Candidatus Daviesbacteria bacterium]|nr:beta-galactosidase [Candidatus Daviesbacteria bacterium]
MGKILKAAIIIFITIITVIIFISFIFEKYYSSDQVKYGVTFSPRYARFLKLDWQKVYLQILDELKVKNLRLPSYWNSLEPEQDQYDFSETDFMLSEAEKRGANVILVLGARQPRWPECQYPDWAKKVSLPKRRQKTMQFVQKVVERYQGNQAIGAWQIENEPFAFWFGEGCDSPNSLFLKEEIGLVKRLDSRPVIITDSGEWGSWVSSFKLADVLGVSIYRRSFNSMVNMYTSYPFTPGMYSLKAYLVSNTSKGRESSGLSRKPTFEVAGRQQNKKIIISELQAEPWLARRDKREDSYQFQAKLFTLADFKDNINFVRKTAFNEAYLWGVEWWYLMAQNGYPEYLNLAKQLF